MRLGSATTLSTSQLALINVSIDSWFMSPSGTTTNAWPSGLRCLTIHWIARASVPRPPSV